MTKTRILGIALILMFLLNLVFIFMWVKRPSHHSKPRPKMVIIEKLGFDDKQITAYQGLIDEHKAAIGVKEKDLAASKANLYALLKENDSSSEADLLSELGTTQTEIERIHFEHFEAVKALCRDDQLAKFNLLTEELSSIFRHRKRPRKQ